MKLTSKILMTALLVGSLVACSEKTSAEDTSKEQPTSQETSQPTSQATSAADESPIKSLTAKNAEATIKLQDQVAYAQYYEITGYKTLTAKQKKVDVTSSNPEVVLVSGTSLKALALGEVTITVTSQADATKTCSFKLTVIDTFFDRTLSSSFTDADDFSKELIKDGATVRTGSSSTLDLVVKNPAVTQAYVETKVTWNSTAESEAYPKFGIFFSSFDNPVVDSANMISDNRVVIFFNPEDCHNKESFNGFGVCEIYNSGEWAWNAGITNDTARHCDYAYRDDNSIGLGGSFTMGVARVNNDFHVWINGAYRFSFQPLHAFFHTDAGDDSLTNFGFFEFNSDVTFSEYGFTVDQNEIATKVSSVTTKSYIGSEGGPQWAAD